MSCGDSFTVGVTVTENVAVFSTPDAVDVVSFCDVSRPSKKIITMFRYSAHCDWLKKHAL